MTEEETQEKRLRGEYGPWHFMAAVLAMALASGGSTSIFQSMGIPTREDIKITVEQALKSHQEECQRIQREMNAKIEKIEHYQEQKKGESAYREYLRNRNAD